MTNPITLIDFLKTGKLGDFCVGLTEDEVRATLGEPDDKGGASRKYKKPNIWLYGTVEVYFSRERSAICTGLFWDASDKGKFRLIGTTSEEDWPWLPFMPRAEVEQCLHEGSIPFVRTDPMPGMITLALESVVRIHFHEDQLTSMERAERRNLPWPLLPQGGGLTRLRPCERHGAGYAL